MLLEMRGCGDKGRNLLILLAKTEALHSQKLCSFHWFSGNTLEAPRSSPTYLVIQWTADWSAWEKRSSQEPANFAIDFAFVRLTLGLGREDPVRFWNVFVSMESWDRQWLSRGLCCEGHWADVCYDVRRCTLLILRWCFSVFLYLFLFLSPPFLPPFLLFLLLFFFLLLLNKSSPSLFISKDKLCSPWKATTRYGYCSRIQLELEIWSHCWRAVSLQKSLICSTPVIRVLMVYSG